MVADLNCGWISSLDPHEGQAIIGLINTTVNDGGTLGYAAPMSETEAKYFLFNLNRRMASGESHVLLGRVGGEPAVMAILTLNGMHNCRHRAEIGKGVVAPQFRNGQVVKAAFREIVRRAEALQVEQLVLDVREGSRAHMLWQRFGFRTYGVLEDYARIGGVSHRGHFMVQTTASLRAHMFGPD
ncbi:GNAT family N-acetyltransferase [Azohydromonas caseinilytica]|uniref:GNAT family N-acetyltransferase n=1 Tax=Azohydromonas caseinilytica TaxID=2728836 RepID=A0A848F3Q4_9BURK|nr:GNAT family N-acetyltransferase [Azohydromonas caseinilytica]NML14022.1 GNAT family N-acetyltransferase [Azohydromonas caseinilytica]